MTFILNKSYGFCSSGLSSTFGIVSKLEKIDRLSPHLGFTSRATTTTTTTTTTTITRKTRSHL